MFYKLVVRPVLFRLPPDLTHELALQYIIWWGRWLMLRHVLWNLDYWTVVIVAFSFGMITPRRWRLKVIIWTIEAAIALRAMAPRV